MLEKTRRHLAAMYDSQPQQGADGKLHKIDDTTRISPAQGKLLAAMHRAMKPALSIEIGFAYGFSTLHILDSMHEHGYGAHIAIDPFEMADWKGIGLANVRALDFSSRFAHVPTFSSSALCQMRDEGVRSSYVYIDGDHRFDGIMVDFHCAHQILEPGGVILFDDMWMPSMQKVAAFISANFSCYARIHTDVPNVFCIKRMADDERAWNHFVNF
jgi:predicted O-methyltransferase YrrM